MNNPTLTNEFTIQDEDQVYDLIDQWESGDNTTRSHIVDALIYKAEQHDTKTVLGIAGVALMGKYLPTRGEHSTEYMNSQAIAATLGFAELSAAFAEKSVKENERLHQKPRR